VTRIKNVEWRNVILYSLFIQFTAIKSNQKQHNEKRQYNDIPLNAYTRHDSAPKDWKHNTKSLQSSLIRSVYFKYFCKCKRDENWCIYCYCFEVFSLKFINNIRYLCNVFIYKNVAKIKETFKTQKRDKNRNVKTFFYIYGFRFLSALNAMLSVRCSV